MRGAAGIVEQVRAAAARVASTYGLEIFDVQFRREAHGMVLRVQLDRPGPAATETDCVGVADCANVSRDLSAVLDVEDLVPGAYTLEVSSPGLDRPLRDRADFVRFAGRLAKVVAREAVDGRTFVRGRLAGVDGDAVVIDGEDHRQHRIPLTSVSRAHLEVEF